MKSKTKADKVEVVEYAILEVHSRCPYCDELIEAREWLVFNEERVAVHAKCKKAVDKARIEAVESARLEIAKEVKLLLMIT